MQAGSRIYVAGHRGMVGSALVRSLRARGHDRIIVRSREELDLLDQAAVHAFFRSEKPEYVFLAAARVGGIQANMTYPAEFIYENLAIATNVIHAAHVAGVSKLVNLGSSCVYPKLAGQPIKEEYLLTGPLEPTNEPYAVAKIAAIKLCDSYQRQYGSRFVSVMPTNLYGTGDNFNLATSHVLPALIRKCHEAKVEGAAAVTVWGSGNARREFLHVDDLADACCLVMERHDEPLTNIGSGVDLTIRELVELVAAVVGFTGGITYDASRPDGTPRKLLDVSRLNALGWRPKIDLRTGIRDTYAWYLSHLSSDGDAKAH